MKEPPLVSICIPAYNAEAHIAATLNSVYGQSYQNIEIIVVNDGSTDATLEILQNNQKSNLRIINQKNRGQCSAANEAFKASKGKYIKFFDADDILSENFIENQLKTLKGRSDAIAAAAWGRFFNNDITTFCLNPEVVWKDMKPIEWLLGSLNGSNMMQCALWLIPREILEKSGLWNEKLSLINDFDFFIRVLLSSKEILFTSNAILYYRSGIESSLSNSKSHEAYQSAFLSTELGVKKILSYENSNRTRQVCANAFQSWCYEFYPQEKKLYCKGKSWVKKLGGSKLKYPAGGKTQFFVSILGWKLTKKIITHIKK